MNYLFMYSNICSYTLKPVKLRLQLSLTVCTYHSQKPLILLRIIVYYL